MCKGIGLADGDTEPSRKILLFEPFRWGLGRLPLMRPGSGRFGAVRPVYSKILPRCRRCVQTPKAMTSTVNPRTVELIGRSMNVI